jgi:hypothetical protein
VTTPTFNPRGPHAPELWRGAPHTFACQASAGRWQCYSWLRALGRRIHELVGRRRGRLIVNAPPQHGKSEFISHWVPTWYLDLFPHHSVILASYGAAYAAEWGRRVRNELAHNPWVRTRLSRDSTAAEHWHTTDGGAMYTAGIDGPLSGRPGNLLIIDDPIKTWEQACSAMYRRRCVEWFESTFYTRRQEDSTIIVVMTRWHPEDLTGYLRTRHADTWEHLCLPALAGPGDALGRPVGAALCPERFGADALEASKTSPAVWQAMYQQDPLHLGIGRVYQSFTRAHVDRTVELRPDLPLHLALDFNIDPGMHAVVGQYDPAADQFTARYELHSPRLSVVGCLQEFQKLMLRHGESSTAALTPTLSRGERGRAFGFPELQVFGDASGRGQWSGTSESCYDLVRQFLGSVGVPFRLRVPRANPAVRDRIDTFNDALRDVRGAGHYRVHPDCVRLIEDLERLLTDGNGLIDKHEQELSHASDAEGYRVWRLRPIRRPAVGSVAGGRVNA